MKKGFVCAIGAVVMCLAFATACDNGSGGGGGGVTPPPADKLAKVIPTVYDVDEIVNADETEAGDVESWLAEVFTKNGGNNDMGTKNALIHSPWHTLEINGTNVPVYTARCGKGSHSFAWVDVADHQDDFVLDVKLTMHRSFAQCVVLPQSKNVAATLEGKTVKSLISAYGSYTYTFSADANAKATDPVREPLTVMVTKEEKLKVPAGFDKVEIEPGYHEDMELEFTEPEMYYVFKPGLHEISSIKVPADSVLWLERGAYLKCTDRITDGNPNTLTAIHMEDCANPQVRGRGLLDMGEVKGGDYKYKHVVNASRCTKPVVEGLTVINSNTWTMCFYNCDEALMERNLLLAYRTYSDGLMMSECRDSAGRYNFVRTGDDAIEFKGTGWGGAALGENCVYEYNDCWTDKGSGYCLTWESACDMTNMVFRNNAVGFAQPTWNIGNNALDCRLGTDVESRWGDVVFKNIEIYHCISPNVIINQVTGAGAILDNILFENISVHSTELGVYAFTMNLGSHGSITDIKIKNYDFCGRKITESDKNTVTMKFEGRADKTELTIS